MKGEVQHSKSPLSKSVSNPPSLPTYGRTFTGKKPYFGSPSKPSYSEFRNFYNIKLVEERKLIAPNTTEISQK